MKTQRSAMTTCLVLLTTLIITSAAWAKAGKIDQEFLDSHIPLVEAVVAENAGTLQTPMDVYRVTRTLLETRSASLAVLNESEPLTSFNGALTQDAYDDVVLRSIGDMLDDGLKQELEIPEEYRARFTQIEEAIPVMGETPVAFMVLTLAQMAVTGGDSLMQDPSVSEDAVATLALGLVQIGWELYEKSNEDLFARSEANQLRQSSVVYRMRCPNDGGSYVVHNMKNKINADNSISILYYLQCEIGEESEMIAFPQELTSRLNQLGEYQKLKRDVEPTRPDKGLEP